jgi:polysaccharide biosynthesis protein PslH
VEAEKRPTILFLTSISTFPINGGEKLRSYALIKMLSGIGESITAVINESVNIPRLDGVRFIPFAFGRYHSRRHFVNILSIFRRNKALIRLLDELTAAEKFDLAFIDYYFYGQYITYFKKKNIKVIYGTHNAEAKLYLQRVATNLKDQFYIWFEFIVQTLHERIFFNHADTLVAVSKEDVQFYQRFIPADKIIFIPNLLEKTSYTIQGVKKENYIIMSANFIAFQNYVGLEWFLTNVWNEELSRRTVLKICGRGSKEAFDKLKLKYNCHNVEAVGEVDDLKPLIANARTSIVPLLNGSGTRLKCLEAMALKTQLISTSKGTEGIEHNGSVLVADTPGEFRQLIVNVLDNKINTVDEAYRVYEDKYSFEPNQAVLSKRVRQLVSVS